LKIEVDDGQVNSFTVFIFVLVNLFPSSGHRVVGIVHGSTMALNSGSQDFIFELSSLKV